MYFSLLWLQLVNTAVFHKALKILQPLKLGGKRAGEEEGVKEMHSFSLKGLLPTFSSGHKVTPKLVYY